MDLKHAAVSYMVGLRLFGAIADRRYSWQQRNLWGWLLANTERGNGTDVGRVSVPTAHPKRFPLWVRPQS